jgi:hypothetical protein
MRKNVLIIIGVALLAIAIGVAVFVSGNGATQNTASVVSPQPSAVIVPFTKIKQGEQSAIGARVNYVLTSSSELIKLWKMVGATGTPPTVDFNKQAVIAVFAGKESTSSIAVAKVEDSDARMVSITLAKPEGACAVKKSAASPYEIVAVPATSLPLTHTDVVTTASCPK